MPQGSKRPRAYRSPLRDEQVNATRAAILGAALRSFEERGFSSATMQEIARAADVSVATVYLYFPGRAAIVRSLADEITAAADLSVEHVERAAGPVSQIRTGAAIIRRLNQRSWLIADILRTAQATDPALAEIWREWQERHLHAVTRAVTALQTTGALRSGLSVLEAIDTLYALAGTDVYRALVGERRWTPERYEHWLYTLACRELLGLEPGLDE